MEISNVGAIKCVTKCKYSSLALTSIAVIDGQPNYVNKHNMYSNWFFFAFVDFRENVWHFGERGNKIPQLTHCL